MNEYKAFLARLKAGKTFLIVSHYNPDGDGIGSMIAMYMMLKEMGKEVVLYNRDGVPDNLKFLPFSCEITQKLDPKAQFDFCIMVDCAKKKRVSDEFADFLGCRQVACVDHHLFEEPDADFKLIDSEAASTGEVVMRLIKDSGFKLTESLAQCIYTTLVVDTGFFKYSNTNSEIFRLAGELAEAGANPWTVAKNLEESYPISRMKLLGFSLESIQTELLGKYAFMEVTQEMLKESGATMDLSDEFAVFPRSIEGVEVSALFREMGDGSVKVSLRSKDFVDVAEISNLFGGGGHARAAGCMIRGQIEEVKQKIKDTVSKMLSVKTF